MRAIFAVIIIFTISFGGPALAARNEKINKLKKQIIEIQNSGKLGVRNLTLCLKIFGYGSYIPYNTNVVPKGKKAYIYFEPGNVFTSMSKGRYSFSIYEDIIITDSKGKVVIAKPKAASLASNSKQPLFETYLRNSFHLNKPGDYIFKIVLYDELRGAKVEAEYPFTIK
ncbi:MAG TPA: hypothetical protein ENI77_12365 [Nitrospirae bacterium]|nr:hypothetical protein [Nitrospirota bacterium]